MKVINQSEFFALKSKTEYRDFKSFKDSRLVANFYNQCCKSLLSLRDWNKLNLIYPISKITICDRYGFNINRFAIAGDVIKVDYHLSSNFETILYLKIDNIKQYKEDDDELFEIALKVDKKPGLGRFYSYFNYQTYCKIKAKRMMNTISVETKINLTDYPHPYMEENNTMVAHFPWAILIKNSLSKL
jgi:hypothetical protein